MSKERLEEVKQYYSRMESMPEDTQEDIRFLIEQAERVRELEEDKDYLHELIDKVAKVTFNVEQQNKRYRELIESTLVEMEGDMEYYEANETHEWSRYDEIKGFYDYITEKFEVLEESE